MRISLGNQNSNSPHFTNQLPQDNKQRVVHDKHSKVIRQIEFLELDIIREILSNFKPHLMNKILSIEESMGFSVLY